MNVTFHYPQCLSLDASAASVSQCVNFFFMIKCVYQLLSEISLNRFHGLFLRPSCNLDAADQDPCRGVHLFLSDPLADSFALSDSQ